MVCFLVGVCSCENFICEIFFESVGFKDFNSKALDMPTCSWVNMTAWPSSAISRTDFISWLVPGVTISLVVIVPACAGLVNLPVWVMGVRSPVAVNVDRLLVRVILGPG